MFRPFYRPGKGVTRGVSSAKNSGRRQWRVQPLPLPAKMLGNVWKANDTLRPITRHYDRVVEVVDFCGIGAGVDGRSSLGETCCSPVRPETIDRVEIAEL
jgi:hypothetical protein